MRLKVLQTGQSIKGRLKLRLAPLIVGAKAPELMRVLFYRPAFFGKPVCELHDEVLRSDDSFWSIGERELFAAFVSAKNACRFCASAHAAIASRDLGEVVHRVIDGERPESLGAPVLAMLPFLERLTSAPETLTRDDIEKLRRAGVRDDAILDAAYVCMIFSVMNRVIDALGCEPMNPTQLAAVSKFLREKGYQV